MMQTILGVVSGSGNGFQVHGKETRPYGDSAYRNTPLIDADRAFNERTSSIRAGYNMKSNENFASLTLKLAIYSARP